MTADVLQIPAPDDGRTDETIRRTVRGIIKGRDLRVEDVAPQVGMTPSTLYRRLAGKGQRQAFAAGEVARLARHFGVEVMDLYTGLGGKFTPPLPRLDSNQKPAGNRSLADVILLPFRPFVPDLPAAREMLDAA